MARVCGEPPRERSRSGELTEYLSAARAADRQYSAPDTNPILDRLRSFGQTRGLAFGAYGEASPDVHALLAVAADWLAARQWRDMGARTPEEARSFIVSSLRRRLGLVICREFARHRIRRVPAGCRTSACRGPSSSGACSAASSSEDRRRECRSTCRTPTSSSTRPARDGAGRPRVRTSAHGRRWCRKAGAERGPRRDGATRLIESRIVLELHAASVPHTDL